MHFHPKRLLFLRSQLHEDVLEGESFINLRRQDHYLRDRRNTRG